MATQGLVTIRSQGRVVMKVVAGCEGRFAKEVAERLRATWSVDSKTAHEIARQIGFGCENCLTVVTEEGILLGGERKPLPSLYRETFQRADFNPRWREGFADFIEIIDL
ncbi:MAG: hypothetical protein ABII19_04325 [Patescibacteria group bacterium]